MQNDDDKALLSRVAEGKTEAMHQLYQRHHDSLLAFVRSRGSDPDTAADVVHDAMLEVWKSAGKYRGTASVRSWIFTIARNKFVDRVRKVSRLSFVDDVPETVDDAPDAESVLEASQDADRVRACLSKLKDAQRAVVRLAFYDGLTYDEIADIEEVPVGTVKSRVFHAKNALLRCLSWRKPVKVAPL